MLARLLEEQEAVLKGEDTPLTWEHLGDMELLHNCMRETLRMYPPLVRRVGLCPTIYQCPPYHVTRRC